MRYSRLGSTGLFVSELCFGTMTFAGKGQFQVVGSVQQADADKLLACAFEAGINLIDTADTYSEGASEEMTGQALKNLGIRRDEVILATKVFGNMGTGPNKRGLSRAHIMDEAKASLKRLQADYIDLYQFHGFDPATSIEESLEAMNDLVRLGFVRYIGVSNWAAWQISKALGVCRRHGFAQFASVQAYYSLAGRDIERELVPMAAGEGLGILAWSPLAGGLLSGKFDRTTTGKEGDRRAAIPFPPVQMDRAYHVIDVLKQIAAATGATVAQLALAWLLQQPQVSSVLIGAKRIEQLNENLGALDVNFSEEELKLLNEASKLPEEYPGWMLAFWSGERARQLQASRI